jgi:hypothetical protein
MINLKVITENYYQVNICDSNLIGTKMYESTINEHFYGKECELNEALNHLRKATMINAIGKEAVALVIKVKGKVQVLDINGIPHTQFYTILTQA